MRDLFQRTIEALQRGKRFVTRDVWRIGRPGEEVPHGFVIKHIRVAILLLKGVVQDDLLLRASALTFATTLALVPFLAIMFLVIQTFHLDENLYLYLTDHLLSITGRSGASAAVDHKDLLQQILQLVMQNVAQSPQTSDGKLLENPVKMMVTYAKEGANPSALGWAGVLFVVATVFGLMMNIESSFNQIWGVKRYRSWYRLLSDYLTILFLLPFLLVGALSLTFAIRLIEDQSSLAFALRSVQYGVIWLVFTGIYMLMPNTKVKFRYAFLGGVVAGSLWSLAAWGYVQFQFGLPRYSLLYSAFAQFPVLLLWLYVSWLILLLGAELAFAYQNEKTFAMERLAEGASHAYREAVGLRVMLELSRRFDQGLPALTPVESAEAWNVPLRLVNETLEILENTGLVVRAAGEPQRYQPARSTERISVGDVVTAVRESGNEPSLLRQDEELLPLFRDLDESHGAHLSRSMADMARQLRAETEPAHPAPNSPTK